jgi:FkbM family methyltransferase
MVMNLSKFMHAIRSRLMKVDSLGLQLNQRFEIHDDGLKFEIHELVELRGLTYPKPIWLRKATSDIATFRKIIMEDEYGLPFAVHPDWIIDAGANIGLSAIYFANKYPEAKVIALEPEPGNFEMLKMNVNSYPNIYPLKAALWPTSTQLHIISYGKLDNFQVASNEDLETDEFLKQKMIQLKGKIQFSCEAFTVEDLLMRFNINRIGIFKIDIEGSEKELFEQASKWIDRADLLVVELHERWKPGSTRSFYMNTPGFDREWIKGESVFVARS